MFESATSGAHHPAKTFCPHPVCSPCPQSPDHHVAILGHLGHRHPRPCGCHVRPGRERLCGHQHCTNIAKIKVTKAGVAITGDCWLECGAPATENVGNDNYPKLVCGACRGAARALQTQIRAMNNETVKKQVATMTRLEPDKYKDLIRSARIGENTDMFRVASALKRGENLSKLTQNIAAAV